MKLTLLVAGGLKSYTKNKKMQKISDSWTAFQLRKSF